jgi:hypothetical protein
MITPVNFDEGQLVSLPFSTGETVVKGGAVVCDTDGYYIMAGSSTAVDVYYVALEDATTTADGQLVLCMRTMPRTIFVVDTDANPARTDVGTLADLATNATVNPDASTNDIFYIEDIVGAVGDKKVRGFFVDSERS